MEELDFCNTSVLSNTGGFLKYGWNDIVDRCNSLSLSGGILTTNRYYFHKDHLGSVVGISDNLGNIVSEYSYDSYGNYSLSGSEIGNDRLFSGREYDKEIGLYYFRARYYSSELGRFISRDPIGQAGGINIYEYVKGNPVNYTDVLGLNPKTLIFWGEDYLSFQPGRNDGKYAFKEKAEAYKNFLISVGKNPKNILVIDGTTFNNWQGALNKYTNINNIVYYGHSNEYGLYLRDATPENINDNEVSGLETLGVSNTNIENYADGKSDHYISDLFNGNSKGVNIDLYGCNSSNAAKEFAKHFEGIGIGSNNDINFDTSPGSNIEFIPVIKPKLFGVIGVIQGGSSGKSIDWNKYDFRK